MTRASDSRRRRADGAFTLIEMLVVIGLVAAALGAATTLLISADRRFRRATEAAGERMRLSLAADRMLAEIRGSSGARESEGTLVLATPGGREVSWFEREGALVRECGGDEDVYDVGLGHMRVAVEPRAGAPFVEVAFEFHSSVRRDAPRPLAAALYVAASPRLKGTP